MKNIYKLFGVIAVVAIIGFSAYDKGDGDDEKDVNFFIGTWISEDDDITLTCTDSAWSLKSWFADTSGTYRHNNTNKTSLDRGNGIFAFVTVTENIMTLQTAIDGTFTLIKNGNSNSIIGGIFTLTDIPESYNGKYAYFMGDSIFGAKSIATQDVTLIQITSGSIDIPLWILKNGNYVKYSGNDTVINSAVYILNSEKAQFGQSNEVVAIRNFSVQIVFSNGNATKSWNSGTAGF